MNFRMCETYRYKHNQLEHVTLFKKKYENSSVYMRAHLFFSAKGKPTSFVHVCSLNSLTSHHRYIVVTLVVNRIKKIKMILTISYHLYL